MRSSFVRFGCGVVLLPTVILMFFVSPALSQERVELTGDDHPLQMEVEDVFSVGVLDGEEWETFSRVSSVAFDQEGNLYILDRGSYHVVKVSPAGEFLLSLGGEGGGPGELGGPMGMALAHDGAVAVFDISQRGFTLFNPDGTFRTLVPLAEGFASIPGTPFFGHPTGGIISAGSQVMRVASGGGVYGSDDTSGRPLNRYSLEDGGYELVFEGWAPEPAERTRTRTGGGGGTRVVYSSSSMRAFDPGFHFGVLPDGGLVVVDSVTYAVKVVGEDGVVRRILQRPIPPTEVTRRVREAEKARRIKALESGSSTASMVVVSGGGGQVTRTTQPPEQAIERIEDMEFAEVIPVVEGLAVDAEGRIWVERSGSRIGEEGPIDLLTAEGGYLGSLDGEVIRIPDAFGPDGLVAFIERDELDVQRVEVKRLRLR